MPVASPQFLNYTSRREPRRSFKETSEFLDAKFSSTNLVTNPNLSIAKFVMVLMTCLKAFAVVSVHGISPCCACLCVIGGLCGVVSTWACLNQLPVLCDMLALLSRLRFVLCWSCFKLIPLLHILDRGAVLLRVVAERLDNDRRILNTSTVQFPSRAARLVR